MNIDLLKNVTPGPWKVRATTFCEDGIPSYEVVMPGEPRMNACDARIIAGAPLMLQALISLAAFDDEGANQTLYEEGKYYSFDQPDAVRVARETLEAIQRSQ